MEVLSLGDIIIGVLKTPEVIGAAVVAVLYVTLVSYIVNYRKKTFIPKKRKTTSVSKKTEKKENEQETQTSQE